MASDRNQPGDVILSWGANSFGQLCNGCCHDKLLPGCCLITEKVLKDVVAITGGGGHTIILTRGSVVYVCGWNGNGQLGIGHLSNVSVPVPILGLQQQRVVKVACGWSHTMALTKQGQLYSWGANGFGQLGIPRVQRLTTVPEKILQEAFAGQLVTDIGAGMRHSAAITADHRVYSWGTTKRGPLGIGLAQAKIVSSPTVVTSLPSDSQPVMVSLGSYHTLILTAAGTVYACGCNEHGQCGVSPATDSAGKCAEAGSSTCATGGSCDPNYVMADDGCWVKCVLTPHVVTGLPPVKQIHSGWTHCMVVSGDDRVFMWGRCDYGQLGLPGWCQNDKHRCCWQPKEVPALQNSQHVACGSEHNLAITADGRLRSWGWNEHGSCGNGDQQNILSPHHVTLMQDGYSPTPSLIGAGAATSFTLVHQHSNTDSLT